MAWLDFLVAFGYPGMFLLNFLGASSIVFPIPYTPALIAAGATGSFHPFLLAIVAGLGSGLGEFVGYGAGYAGRSIVGEGYERKFEAMLKIFNKYGTPAIFVFALTPLPDDLLFIPLGLARYEFIKAFIPCVLGKFLMALILIYIGKTAGWFIGQSWISAFITGIILIIIMYIIFRLDWVKIAERFA
ncbi:hypothetical protein AKJ61_01675 [candidate division MSBL1 archaeon SCGC-AAA259B11]|uniref:VTT domain-containing protein n=1 Tax=candidate division MSBL1 archaeon SCGC-AAA259B11 TaxID=1698260 RepID=A0A133U737_9EURY|nr:hypothetical protein AKJ61_01675 [candidate division MSBL1 archaeon SCGC-AAA259B11]